MKLCSIASGSSGNCIFAGTEKTGILIDAGISGKRIEAGLNTIDRKTADIDGIFVTHEHIDHIAGLGVIARRYGIPIYTTPGTYQAVLNTKSVGKMPEGLFHAVQPDTEVQVGDLTVHPFRISHDAADPLGYRVEAEGKKAAVATDLGFYNEYITEQLKGLDCLLLESNHDVRMLEVGSYPYYLKKRILGNRGHLSNETAGRLLCEVLHDHMKHIVLGHLSRENNYPSLAYETVCSEVTMGDNPWKSGDFHITVAKRDEPGELLEF
ncbi:MAG: MBL fold metallo-hydrolase [Lachnospiraceae bacterium]|nr:MBL fold metallo-hydrolase [Lachnospiraceae bacterium]